MVPVGFTSEGGALVAWTAGVGTAVGSLEGADDVAVGCDGTAVGSEVVGSEVAVAEDPHANSRATNKNTIALGKCLKIPGLDLDIGTTPSYLEITFCDNKF